MKSSLQHENACGPAGAAAAIAAAKAIGRTQGYLLAHTNSSQVLEDKFRQSSTESVGYAAIVF